jgi:hypothetical protein
MSGIDFSSRISYEPYHIYYDLNIINNDNFGTRKPPSLQFTEIRNSPYLSNPSDYFASVVRFSLETPTLPVIVPQALVGSANIDTLIYTISLSHPLLVNDAVANPPCLNQTIQSRLVYVPQSNPAYTGLPNPPIQFQDIESDYYYVYTYQPFIDMVNTALKAAWVSFTSNAGMAGLAAGFLACPPFLYFDPNSCKATFVVPQAIFQTPSPLKPTPTLDPHLAGNPCELYFNAPLWTLFSSFDAFQDGYGAVNGVVQGKNWRVLFKDMLTIAPPSFNATLPQYQAKDVLYVEQLFPTTPLWNPVQAIVFTTSLMPIAPSLVSVPILFGRESQMNSAGNNSNISNVLTDLEVPLDKGWENKPSIFYSPTSEYRLFDLNGNAPLSAIEISVFWKDQFGGLHPFKLASGCNSSLKLMFRRKDFQGVL